MFEKSIFYVSLRRRQGGRDLQIPGVGPLCGGRVRDGMGRAPRTSSLDNPSVTDAALVCPPCCPCVCHVAKPGLELRWVPVGSSDDILRAPCRASPLRASRSRINPPVISHPPVVLTSYRSTAERKLLPPLKPPKPTRVRQDSSASGELPQPDLELPSEDGIQTGTRPGS